METKNVLLDLIDPHPSNPREDMGDIEALARSIETIGLLQPPGVIATSNGRYMAEFGHRRIEAARRAGLLAIHVYVRDDETDADAYLALIAENDQHKPLSVAERAKGQQGLLDLGDLERASDATGVPMELLQKASRGRVVSAKAPKPIMATLEQYALLADLGDMEGVEELLKAKPETWGWKVDEVKRKVAHRAAIAEAAELADRLEAREEPCPEGWQSLANVLDAAGKAVAPEDAPVGSLVVKFNRESSYMNPASWYVSHETIEAQGWHMRWERPETPEEIEAREAREAEKAQRAASVSSAAAARIAFIRTQLDKPHKAIAAAAARLLWKGIVVEPDADELAGVLGYAPGPHVFTSSPEALMNVVVLTACDRAAFMYFDSGNADDTDAEVLIEWAHALTTAGYGLTPWEKGCIEQADTILAESRAKEAAAATTADADATEADAAPVEVEDGCDDCELEDCTGCPNDDGADDAE